VRIGKISSEQLLQQRHMLGPGVVDQQHEVLGVRLERDHGLDGWRKIGGRLVTERHHGDVGELGRFDHARFDEPAEVDDHMRALEAIDGGFDGLAGVELDDAVLKDAFVDVGGAGIGIVGEQGAIAMAGVADGVRRLSLPSFDRVEEHGHVAIVKG
jgi:hypothetical protein